VSQEVTFDLVTLDVSATVGWTYETAVFNRFLDEFIRNMALYVPGSSQLRPLALTLAFAFA